MDPISYTSELKREGKLSVPLKIAQGLGSLPDSFKDYAFKTFLLLYYDRILGMPASWAAAALFVALVVDAISDPLVGSLSDNFRSKLGRRHPFMFAAALPLGLAIFLLFSPPGSLDEVGLFFWLLTFTISTRVAMTFFYVPWSALFAEFSDDYVERSVLASYRLLVVFAGLLIFVFSIYSLIFASNEAYPEGQLNPHAYSNFAMVLGICMALPAFLTTWFTRKEVPYLLQPVEPSRFSVTQTLSEVRLALSNRNFRVLFLCVLVTFILGGTNGAFEIYMRTYFWGLASEDLRWFALSAIGAIAVLVLIPPLQKRFDKKNTKISMTLSEVRLALSNRNFRVLFLCVLVTFILGGTNGAFEIYMRTYFWGLASEDLRWFALSAIGAIAVLVLIPPLQKRFDKKNLLVGGLFLLLFDGTVLVCLRFLEVLPDNGDPRLLWLLVGNGILRGALYSVLLVMFISMLADLLDKQELDTGRRQEGIFMSSISFSAKATSGFGLLLAGLLLEFVIGFPQGGAGVSPADLDAQTVFRLGLMDGVVVPLFYIIPFAFLARGYDLTRHDHEVVQQQLALVRENRAAVQSGGAS